MTKKPTGPKPPTMSPVEKAHLMTSPPMPPAMKRSASITAAGYALRADREFAGYILDELLSALGLWPDDHPRAATQAVSRP